MAMESTLFELDNLQKLYGRFEALGGLTLKMPQGSIGLLGPNGAGKSTLIKTLLGLLSFQRGSAQVLGWALPGGSKEIRSATGYMPENDCYLPYMTAVNYVSFGGQLVGMPRTAAFRRAHEVLHYVGLGEARYRKLEGFSTGMKQRVKLAQALVHGPRLLFLDEPTNGLDPKGREEMLELIEDVKARGVNIVLSSHLLADVERVCESVIMMNQGEVLYHGGIAEFTKTGGHAVEVGTKSRDEELATVLKAKGFGVSHGRGHVVVEVTRPARDRGVILATALEAGIEIRHFKTARMTLEEAFLSLLQERQRHDAVEGGKRGDS